jgi:hypothetical protein
MAFNYMSRSILFVTHQQVNLYSITKSALITSKSFAEILNEPQGKTDLY